MSAITTEDREAMREAFGRLLAERSAEADVRRAMEMESGFDAALWDDICAMGVTGLLVSPDFGGLGAGALEVEVLMEEAGAALLCSPLFSSGVLAAGLLTYCGDAAAQGRLLPAIVTGGKIATVALTGDRGRWTAEDVAVVATPAGEGWTLQGHAAFVTHGHVADILLVVARTAQGLSVFEVDPQSAEVERQRQETFDHTLRLARISFAGAPAAELAGAGEAVIERMLDMARIALAGERAGASRRIFEITIDYIKTRIQFGRPIGGFQALKHMASDLLLEVESGTSAARAAAASVAAAAPDAAVMVNLAAFATADSFSQVAATAIQMHGGIAYTWDYPAHLYLRRARADARLLGPPSLYRDRYVAALENAA